MQETYWRTITQLRDRLEDEREAPVENERLLWTLKFSRDVGRLAESAHGAATGDERHSWEAVREGLCELIVASMVTMAMVTPNAPRLLSVRLFATDNWAAVRRLRLWLDSQCAVTDEAMRLLRVLKVVTEVGELADAVHGAFAGDTGHNWTDAHDEFCDLIVKSMLALDTLTPDPRAVFEARLQQIADESEKS